MLDDLKGLYAEFDLHSLTHPDSVEHFMMNLVIVGVIAVAAYFAIKLIAQFF